MMRLILRRSMPRSRAMARWLWPALGTAPGFVDSGVVVQAACAAWLMVSYSMGVRRPSRRCRRRR